MHMCKKECLHTILPKGVSLSKRQILALSVPGYLKPLVTSQFPQKVSIQITLPHRLQKRKLEETTINFAF